MIIIEPNLFLDMATNIRKSSKSVILTTAITSKIDVYIKNGKFTTIPDILHTAIPEFLGKISLIENIENFNLNHLTIYFSEAIELEKKDKSENEKVTVAFNNYTLDELLSLSETTKTNRSYIIRIALFDFFIKLENPSQMNFPSITQNNYPQTKNELENFIIETFKKINHNSN